MLKAPLDPVLDHLVEVHGEQGDHGEPGDAGTPPKGRFWNDWVIQQAGVTRLPLAHMMLHCSFPSPSSCAHDVTLQLPVTFLVRT